MGPRTVCGHGRDVVQQGRKEKHGLLCPCWRRYTLTVVKGEQFLAVALAA
jgi:hypothetical protein